VRADEPQVGEYCPLQQDRVPWQVRNALSEYFQVKVTNINTVQLNHSRMRVVGLGDRSLKDTPISTVLSPAGAYLPTKRRLFSLLFEASAATFLEVAMDPKHLGAETGFLSILHTWGQKLERHPHIHCVVPGGGLSPDHAHWIPACSGFFLPVKVLSRVFRGKFVAGLRHAFRNHQLVFYGACSSLKNESQFAEFLRTLFRQDWVVYAKPPFGGAEHVLHYLARYTHRVAISNHRLLSVSHNAVSFRWKDYAHGSQQRTLTISPEEFLRRFLQHVLPKGFPRIRYFGWLANRRRRDLLPLCRYLLHQQTPATNTSCANETVPVRQCPNCNGPMYTIERFTAAEIYFVGKVHSLDSS